MTILIGLIGKKRAGKDTFARTLIEEFGYTRLSFADPLRELALTLNPIVAQDWVSTDRLRDVVAYGGWESAKEDREVRRLLQELGNGVRQHIAEDAWLRPVQKAITEGPGPFVVTDVRYPNEAEVIQKMHGLLVRIVRPGQDRSDQHVSETALDGWRTPFIIDNHMDLSYLAQRARDIHHYESRRPQVA